MANRQQKQHIYRCCKTIAHGNRGTVSIARENQMDRFQAMQVFTAVVDANSFTRAADNLNLPRTTVTTIVQGLESLLQVRLLNRTTRRISLTPDGAAYYERCVRILAEVDETEAS